MNQVPYLVESACSSTMIDVEGIHISFSDFSGPLDQGENDMMSVYMSNPYDVYGFELHILIKCDDCCRCNAW